MTSKLANQLMKARRMCDTVWDSRIGSPEDLKAKLDEIADDSDWWSAVARSASPKWDGCSVEVAQMCRALLRERIEGAMWLEVWE